MSNIHIDLHTDEHCKFKAQRDECDGREYFTVQVYNQNTVIPEITIYMDRAGLEQLTSKLACLWAKEAL